MSLSATLFGRDSLIFKATNILGLGIPGLLDKWFGAEGPPAQRLGEISQQTAKEAEPRVIVFGRVRPIGGNLIHCQEPIKRMIKVKTESGGKGGSKKKQTQKVEHVFRTYAIGVCEGPITAFVRVWRNNKLVYDARGNDWGIKNNPVFLKSFQFYTGAWNQLPSPALEKIWGVGNVPAYRGTAYMVSVDEDLTDTGGMVPQWQFEVERAEGTYLTSKPYPTEQTDDLQIIELNALEIRDRHSTKRNEELSEVSLYGMSLNDFRLRALVYRHDEGFDDLNISGLEISELILNNDPPPEPLYVYELESVNINGLHLLDMRDRVSRIRYEELPHELSVDGMYLLGVNFNGAA